MPQPTCYMCDQSSTSREHVPPRCLFPESKDVRGDFRQNLLTVPSCDEHNSGKSADDEFLMVSSRTILGYIPSDSPNPAEFQRFIRDKVAIELEGKPRLGSNPDVFNFQFTAPDQFGLYLVHLQFYGGLDVYVSMTTDGCQIPANLAMLLIDGGIETTIKLGAEEYKFNIGS